MKTFLSVLKYGLLILFVLSFPVLVNAQPGFGDDVSDVPLDGGISLLVAAGIGYGARKMHKQRKLNNGPK
jgi:hypothetical protein